MNSKASVDWKKQTQIVSTPVSEPSLPWEHLRLQNPETVEAPILAKEPSYGAAQPLST